MTAAKEWLELSEASEILGVHPSTLRRWADAGMIAHFRTLNGRRRFSRSSIEQARGAMHQAGPDSEAGRIEIKTLDLARQRTGSLIDSPQVNWANQLSNDQRLLFRYSGQRLLGLVMQYISRGETAETFLAEGKRVAGDYGRICYNLGLSVSQMAEAFLYFRRTILESVQTTAGLGGPHDQDGHRIMLRTIDFFDALLVATIESYGKTNPI